jgi:hypothetical protein
MCVIEEKGWTCICEWSKWDECASVGIGEDKCWNLVLKQSP